MQSLCLAVLCDHYVLPYPRSGILRKAEINDQSVKNPEFKGSPFKAWRRSEYSPACFADRHGFSRWTNFYLPSPFTLIYFQNIYRVFHVLVWLMHVPVSAGRIKLITPLVVTDDWCRFLFWMPTKYRQAPKLVLLCIIMIGDIFVVYRKPQFLSEGWKLSVVLTLLWNKQSLCHMRVV